MNKKLYYQMNTNRIPQITLISATTIEPPYIHFKRKADEFIMYYIIAGEMHLEENKIKYILKPGDIIILDPSHEHFGIKSSTCTYSYIHFTHPDFLESYDNLETLKPMLLSNRISSLSITSLNESHKITLPKYFHITNDVFNSNFLCDINKIISSSKTKLEHYLLQGNCMFVELLINLSREFITFLLSDDSIKTLKSQKIIQDILSFFNEYYYEKITSEFLELQYNCNFDYINRIFKETTGKTIFIYLNELRISQAKLLFNNGSFKVSEVSEKVGFQDPYYFSKVFKKYTGITPSTYIKSINL